ncbi:hypothetical protein COO59_03270 [Mixta theicola]|uniref:CdiI immunity protein domain-containing protein n=1 Tax=Mixta theicola TaxID=1458355 RepID=A0A2K1QD44_9GAMM|nr:hypothetical protein [Mixta theicola]PNS12950.1 hypothetical protein COO59_03270 [Mixta theicola]GLR09202.1 hypothetical protein GCM10007905_19220 [Mixta theicola]
MSNENYPSMREFFDIIWGPTSSDSFGFSYPEMVSTYINSVGRDEYLDYIIADIDKFLKEHPENASASVAFDALFSLPGFSLRFPPTLTVFLTWLSSYLKELAQQ